MKKPKTADILGIINKIAPTILAEAWDNPGLHIGNPTDEVSRVMIALDPTPDVVDSAIAASCQLLVTHHPFIFKPLKSISTSNTLGASIHKTIKSGLAVISMHTNYDIASGGLNDLLAAKLGVTKCTPLKITATDELVKLVVFVPAGQLEQLRDGMSPFTAAQGNYRDCSFTVSGTGTFTPLAGSEPFTGTIGKLSSIAEERLELLVARSTLPRAIKTLLAKHPYEEPAFDIYPLLKEGAGLGLGRIGYLREPVTLADYAVQLKNCLSAPALRYVGNPASRISKVALCSGSGASLLHEAARSGADVLVTGDIKYHEARDAENIGLALIDAGHFPTEIIMVQEIKARLDNELFAAGYKDCQVLACNVEKDPFRL